MGATIWNQWSFNSQVGIPQIEQSSNLVHYSKKKRAHFEKKKDGGTIPEFPGCWQGGQINPESSSH
jgi:hypothetical protein